MIFYILTNYSYCFNVFDFVKNQLLSFVYTHERLDFPFCIAHIARLYIMGCAEIGKA